MKRLVIPILLAGVLAGAAALYFFSGQHYTLRLSEDQVRSEIEAWMPFTRTYLLIFDATLDQPRVTLADGSDRVNVAFDAMLAIRTRRDPVPLRGTIEVSGGVQYIPERGELFLTDPRVEEASILRVPEQYQAGMHDALNRALSEYFRTRPIYTLTPTDARYTATRLLLRDVRIEDRHLVLAFGLR